MLYDKGDSTVGYLLHHNRESVQLQNLYEWVKLLPHDELGELKVDLLVKIDPDEAYWRDRLGVYSVDLTAVSPLPKDLHEMYETLAHNYWIPSWHYRQYRPLLKKAEIPEKHWDDLMLVIHYYKMYRLTILSSEAEHNKAIQEMLRFVDALERPPYDIQRISVVLKPVGKKLSPRTYSSDKTSAIAERAAAKSLKDSQAVKIAQEKAESDPSPTLLEKAANLAKIASDSAKDEAEAKRVHGIAKQDENFKLTDTNVLRDLIDLFKKWVKESDEYKHLFEQYMDLTDDAKPPKKIQTEKSKDILLWVYSYLLDKKLATNHHNASFKTAILLSRYGDLVPSEEYYELLVTPNGSPKG